MPYGTDGSGVGVWPWMAYTGVRVAGRALTHTERKKQDMAQIEEELDDLVMGRGQYARQFASDGIRVFLERHAVIPRSETCDGGITDRGDYVTAGSGPESASGSINDNPNWLRNRAMNLLTIADYLENRERIVADVKAAKAAALGKRRDELADEFTAVNSYNGQLPYTKNLINRIIDLEDAAK